MKKLHIYLLGRLLITVTLACTMAVSTFGGLLQVGASTISIESQKKDNNQAVTLLENNVYNDIDGAWIYKGNWWKATVSSALGGQLHDSSGVGDNAAISITGSRFTLIFSRGPDYGKLDVVIDGQNIHRIDQTRTTNYYQKEWTSPELAMGTHIIKFVHAKGKLVNIDAIKVYGTTPNPSSTPTGSPVITQTPTVAIITSPTNSGPVQDATSTLPPNPTVSPTPSLIPSPIANATSTLAPTQVSGTQIYYVSTSGSDFNPGTQTQPWKTIQKAVDTVPPGSTVIVKAGTYDQRVAIKRSILSLVADGKVTTKAIDVTGDNNIVRGFTFTDPSANAGITVEGNNNLFEKNEIYHTAQDGIWFFGHDNTFRGNYIHDILDPSIGGDPHVDCFQSWGWNWDTYNVLFEKNVCNHTRTSGSNQIVMLARNTTAQVRDITFRNNIFIMHDAGYSPLNVARKVDQGEISGIQILNNTFYNTTGAGNDAVKMTSVVNGLVVDNVSIGYADFAQISGGSVTLSKNVSSGPYGMVDYVNFNFHLTSNSPLINAGIDDGLRDDFDGTSRPQGTSMDIGAFEYQP